MNQSFHVQNMTTPPPPPGFQTWSQHINYKVHSMNHLRPLPSDSELEVSEELLEIARRRGIKSETDRRLKWLNFLEEWWPDLSQRLNRTFEDVLYNHILQTDYPSESVQVQFSEGSVMVFRNAFCLGVPPEDGGKDDLHVFSKHCGYHRFVVGLDDHIKIVQQH
jgi:hypothetical protein